jgi:putative membrane protein insertion efficiency factor
MKKIVIGFLKLYKKFISPVFEAVFGGACRFTPSCSQYTIEALEKFGVVKGLTLGFKRFIRCHPWGGSGWDPVPIKS